jgi:hypothetical protein
LTHWLDMPDVERLAAPLPSSPAGWVERFPGRLVCLTAIDRTRPSKAKHAGLTLFGPAIQSLSRFPRLAEVSPPRDRLSRLGAVILNEAVPVDAALRVELIRIPDVVPSD